MFRPLLAPVVLFSICCTASAQSYKCAVEHYGKSCGPKLTATCEPNGNTYFASLVVTGAKPDSKLIMAIGAEKTNYAMSLFFPGKTLANCRLLVVPVFIQQHNPDANGNYTFGRALPATPFGTGHAQFVELQANGTVLATNGASIIAK